MAKKNQNITTEPKQPISKLVCCRSCLHAYLLQYGTNPVLADCHQKPQPGNERFPYQREVACVERTCALYTYQAPELKEIEHRAKEAAA